MYSANMPWYSTQKTIDYDDWSVANLGSITSFTLTAKVKSKWLISYINMRSQGIISPTFVNLSEDEQYQINVRNGGEAGVCVIMRVE